MLTGLFTKWRCWLLAGLLLAAGAARAQVPEAPGLHPAAAPAPLDVADVAHRLYPRLPAHDSASLAPGHRVLLLVPVVGYSQQTSGVAELALNLAYRAPAANVSTMVGAAQYTLNNQLIFTLTSALWRPGNRWALLGDWRIMRYPQSTYGLGMYTNTTDDAVSMDYKYLRLYQTVLRRVAPAWYVGVGMQLDDHWDIVSRNRRREVTSISHYPYGVSGRSVSVGPVLSLLHDGRTNAINPQGGYLFNVQYRPNLHALGSDRNFQSMIVEGRLYLHPSPRSANILALWSYNALTLSGNPPFLDLPATGWDMYGNTGRGFIQGRFRGRNLVYGEAEYRYGITRNRLLGGVVFANAQSVSEINYTRGKGESDGGFEKVVPALGAGLRLNLNKISHTNLAIDYAWGLDGSHGLALNLGEVF
ncbi:BamA/TamA family outer membrane protein [Hymenobacter sp. RP-2-7]|uniref:BamA/TamA family outer membrane protein n=1 Tax=Hymenobacter polaris TaxID=2682546 RepID=A0A7Y0FLS2_9BACT|nr:BamA/TamA family outer membrane protein [Hymenobacter polaris]NML65098.1 BamA/TamA family outer membrane protein [Hymenobacter polaris]